MNSLLVHGITRCSYGMLRLVQGNDIVIYAYEIQQKHVTFYWVSKCIYALYSQSIVIYTWQLYRDTLPDAYFACYRLAHDDDDKCMNCMLQLLHRIDIDCFRFEFSFLLVSSSLPIWVSIHVHISLAFVVLIICGPWVGFCSLESIYIIYY